MAIDPTLLTVLTQGGFAAMFIWLLIDTRQDSRKREERLMSTLEEYSKNLPGIATTLAAIEKRLERIEDGQK